MSPKGNSDPVLVFQYHETADVRRFRYEWTSERIRLTRDEFGERGERRRNLKPQNIRVASSYQYHVLQYDSTFEEGELEEGEVRSELGRSERWKRTWMLERELKVSR